MATVSQSVHLSPPPPPFNSRHRLRRCSRCWEAPLLLSTCETSTALHCTAQRRSENLRLRERERVFWCDCDVCTYADNVLVVEGDFGVCILGKYLISRAIGLGQGQSNHSADNYASFQNNDIERQFCLFAAIKPEVG